ncbi:MAG: BsaWI family type II restriction enzyme [Candidatus Parvarchaeota archaeon]
MKFQDLINIYEKQKERYGSDVYKHISEILDEAKKVHYNDWRLNPSPNGDHEQSWRAFKGKNFEKLVLHIIKSEVENLGLKVISGNTLERSSGEMLSKEEGEVKRHLLIDYGTYGSYMPDVDLVIYDPNENYKIIAVISNKITLRERIAQTGYWKIKLSQDILTKGIKVFFITPDEDGTLTKKNPMKKGRVIVEVDTDGSYVMSEKDIEESEKVKKFDKFIDDLRRLVNER